MNRTVSLCIAAFALVLLVAGPVSAQISPTETIRQTVNDILNIIKDPGMHDQQRRQGLLVKVEKHITSIFDFSEFSARTVGPKWRQFTPDQKKRFEEAFAQLFRATYIEKLDGYHGEKVSFTGEVSSTKGDRAEVLSVVLLKDKEVPVSYRLLKQNDLWRIYDVRIENVSLIENYRGQFKEILLKGTPEELIAKVQEKAKEVAQQNQAVK